MELYKKGQELIIKDLDVMKIVESIKKLKAGMAALIRNNRSVIREAERIHINNNIIEKNKDNDKYSRKTDNALECCINDSILKRRLEVPQRRLYNDSTRQKSRYQNGKHRIAAS